MNAKRNAALCRSVYHYYNFIECPGGMTASMPHQDPNTEQMWGSITIHIPDLLAALTYLRRRYKVTGTSASNQWGAIIVHIEVRQRKRSK